MARSSLTIGARDAEERKTGRLLMAGTTVRGSTDELAESSMAELARGSWTLVICTNSGEDSRLAEDCQEWIDSGSQLTLFLIKFRGIVLASSSCASSPPPPCSCRGSRGG